MILREIAPAAEGIRIPRKFPTLRDWNSLHRAETARAVAVIPHRHALLEDVRSIFFDYLYRLMYLALEIIIIITKYPVINLFRKNNYYKE